MLALLLPFLNLRAAFDTLDYSILSSYSLWASYTCLLWIFVFLFFCSITWWVSAMGISSCRDVCQTLVLGPICLFLIRFPLYGCPDPLSGLSILLLNWWYSSPLIFCGFSWSVVWWNVFFLDHCFKLKVDKNELAVFSLFIFPVLSCFPSFVCRSLRLLIFSAHLLILPLSLTNFLTWLYWILSWFSYV